MTEKIDYVIRYLDGRSLTVQIYAESSSEATNLGAAIKAALSVNADLRGARLGGADLRGARLGGADLGSARLRGADLRGATMADGLKFETYLSEVVPALLTAGGRTIAEIVAAGAWQCHSWNNCPMRVAFGIKSGNDAPLLLRARVAEFVQLFDAGLIPEPKVTP